MLQRVDGKFVNGSRQWQPWTQIVEVAAGAEGVDFGHTVSDRAAQIAIQREGKARGSNAGLSVHNVEPCNIEGAKDGDRYTPEEPEPGTAVNAVIEGADAPELANGQTPRQMRKRG